MIGEKTNWDLRSTLISIRQTDVDRLMIRTQSKGRVRVRVRSGLGLGLGLLLYIFKSKHPLSANPRWCRD